MSFEPKTLLVPTDFSAPSDAALALATEVARRYHAKITLFHVIQIGSEYSGGLSFFPPDFLGDLQKQAESELTKRVSALRASEVSADSTITIGAPQGILRYADELKPGLIILGTHGRTGLKHLLLGSVAERVVRLAECPVLVVPDAGRTRAKADAGAHVA